MIEDPVVKDHESYNQQMKRVDSRELGLFLDLKGFLIFLTVRQRKSNPNVADKLLSYKPFRTGKHSFSLRDPDLR